MAIKLGILAFWSFVAAIVSGSIAPHRAYRCALILGILFIAEFVGMRWWVSWMVHPANFGMGLIHYLAATPEFITTFLFLFLGAALARRMRRDNPLPKAA